MKIVNVRGLVPWLSVVTYVGRQCAGWPGSPLGNPFKVRRGVEITTVLSEYRKWLYRELTSCPDTEERASLHTAFRGLLLRHVAGEELILGCWCCDRERPSPTEAEERCHAEIIGKAILHFATFDNPDRLFRLRHPGEKT